MSHVRRLDALTNQLVPSRTQKLFSNTVNGEVKEPIRITITGAAGSIGYALAFMVAGGFVFGMDQPVILHILELEEMQKGLEGVHMELRDGAYSLLHDIVVTTDPAIAFKHADFAVLIGAFPRKKDMQRKDLLRKNAAIFKEQGMIIDEHANKSVKILVVGNPANTNCLIASKFAPSIPLSQWTCLTRLDQNRAVAQISSHMKVPISDIKKVIIWGNHSMTQFPDCYHATVKGRKLTELVGQSYLRDELVPTVQGRGAEVIQTRGTSSSQSAARAIACHLHDWFLGTMEDDWVSMGVVSDGSYGVPVGLVFSYPVIVQDGKIEIVKGLELDYFAREKLALTVKELVEERDEAFEILSIQAQ